MKNPRHLFAGLLATITLAGCGGAAFDQRALDYGRTLSNSTNQQIVLNILRSAAREPVFFTLVSNVDSRSRGDIDINAESPFRIASSAIDLAAGIGLEDPVPRFSVSSLMNASFTRSLSRPVDLGILERLLARDFNNELVMRLLIGHIGWESEPLLNGVDTFETGPFQRRLRLLMAMGLSAEPLLGDNTLIEDLEQDDVLDLIGGIEAVATPRLSIVPDRKTGDFDIIGEPGGFRLCFRRPPVLSLDDLSEREISRAVDLTCRIWVVSQLTGADLGGRDLKRLDDEEKGELLEAAGDQIERNAAFLRTLDESERSEGDGTDLDDLVENLLSQSESGEEDGVGEQELGRLEHFGGLALTIRSPLEIFDYLGALTRDDLARGDDAPVRAVFPDARYRPQSSCSGSTCDPLTFFRLRRGVGPATGTNAVRFEGFTYDVPNALAAPDDRSIETLGVLSDLIALFIEGDDVSDTARVTILP